MKLFRVWGLAVCAAVGPTIAGAAGALFAGRTFPLGNETAPILLQVQVQRIQSDGLIDVAVSFAEPRPASDATADELVELGELCMRYGADILQQAVPAHERERLRVIATLYRSGTPAPSGGAEERGFAFSVTDGDCSLAEPFPAAAREEVLRRLELAVQPQ